MAKAPIRSFTVLAVAAVAAAASAMHPTTELDDGALATAAATFPAAPERRAGHGQWHLCGDVAPHAQAQGTEASAPDVSSCL